MEIMLCAQVNDLETWRTALAGALGNEPFCVWPQVPDPSAVKISLIAKPPRGVLAGLPNLQLICSLWAGVDGPLSDPAFPRHVPFTRLIDPKLTSAMVESVVLHVLSVHRLAPRYRAQQGRGEWIQHVQPHAEERTVAILGLGELGRACADALRPLGFHLVGWSRSPRAHPGVECLHGDDGLDAALARADIAVLLLPNTAETRGLLDARRLSRMPRGAGIVNVGRGPVIDDAALVAALDAGHLEAAILDVFATEPLPAEHPFWRHEKVWVYPHVAAETDPRSAARVVAETVRRFRAGAALPERVDPERGY